MFSIVGLRFESLLAATVVQVVASVAIYLAICLKLASYKTAAIGVGRIVLVTTR